MENMNNMNDVALDWNSVIVPTDDQFVTLSEGIYDFTVTKFERSQFSGSAKIKACPCADITIKCTGAEGTAFIRERLFLSSSFMWKLSAFFFSIGQGVKGQPLTPDWNSIIGSTGKVKIYVDRFVGKDGTQKTNNKVSNWLPRDHVQAQPTVPTTVQQPVMQQTQINPQQAYAQQLLQNAQLAQLQAQQMQQPVYQQPVQQVQQHINPTVQANMNKLGINPNDQIPF